MTDLASHFADAILADDDARADYEIGVLRVTPDVDAILRRKLPVSPRDLRPDDVNFLRADDAT